MIVRRKLVILPSAILPLEHETKNIHMRAAAQSFIVVKLCSLAVLHLAQESATAKKASKIERTALYRAVPSVEVSDTIDAVDQDDMARQNISTICRENVAKKDAKTTIELDKQQWMLQKRELGRASAEAPRLNPHVSLLNKYNSRLEKDNEEQKSGIATLRLRNDETLGKGTQ